MGAITCQASNTHHKHTPSHKRCDKNIPATAPAPQCAKTVVFGNWEQISSDLPYVDEEPSDVINEPEDVLMQEYTLATSVMLGTISIYGDTISGPDWSWLWAMNVGCFRSTYRLWYLELWSFERVNIMNVATMNYERYKVRRWLWLWKPWER